MLNRILSSMLLSSVLVMGGCKSADQGSVSQVPPPSSSGPITATNDHSLNGPQPVALKSNTPTTQYGAFPAAPDTYTLGAPGPVAPAASLGGGNYVVRQGDTLWSISNARYGTGQRWKDILAANPGLTAERLPVGRAIVLP